MNNNEQKHTCQPPDYIVLPMEVEKFESLAELALDISSLWNHATNKIRWQINSIFWDLTHNPWVVLQKASRDLLEQLPADPAFRKKIMICYKSNSKRQRHRRGFSKIILSLNPKYGV